MQVGLKERLIGAVILVIIAAIVIPWVLKGNSTPGGATVSTPLVLPAATTAAPTQTYLLPLNTSAANTAAVAEPSATARAPVAVPTTQPDTTKHKLQVQRAVPVPAAAPVPRSQPASQSKPAPPAGKWVVQAGSFDSERSALAVERKLAAHGYHAYISRYRTKGNTLYRVRVGPFSSRDQAAHEVAGVSRAAGTKAAVMPNS